MIPGNLYSLLYVNLILMFTLISAYHINSQLSDYNRIHRIRIHNEYLAWIIAILIVLFFGFRPINDQNLGDTIAYAKVYESILEGFSYPVQVFEGDYFFNHLMLICSRFTTVNGFFLIIAAGYVICSLMALRRLFSNNVWVAFLMYISAFSFYSYGINGIRNGLGAAIFLLALSYSNRKWVALIFMVIAVGIHKSMMLPVAALIISYFYKNSKFYIILWVVTIPMSLIFGGFWNNLFASMGFDDRLDYLTDTTYANLFSLNGFRWDFLMYSAVPIIVGYYVVFRRKMTNTHYTLLLNTYTLSNAFWILVNTASYSNRFAYLSWFLYPVVLLYPFLKFPLWKNQYKKVALVLLLHVAFTYFMWLIGK